MGGRRCQANGAPSDISVWEAALSLGARINTIKLYLGLSENVLSKYMVPTQKWREDFLELHFI